MNRYMKITNIAMLTALLLVGSALAADQTASTDPKPPPSERPPESLTKFDLDFKGGSPKDLVAAIQKAMGKPLNALVPDEFANVTLPEFKMKNVNAPQLFQALERASRRTEYVQMGGTSSLYSSGFGFRANSDKITDDTIWYFYLEKPHTPPQYKDCRFYSLARYLDSGISVDDITTAIKTGAKMLGDADEPSMSFHKDTKLLIAVGEPAKLQIIDSVLRALEATLKPPAAAHAANPAAKSGEEK
jgi:hypothetical protein